MATLRLSAMLGQFETYAFLFHYSAHDPSSGIARRQRRRVRRCNIPSRDICVVVWVRMDDDRTAVRIEEIGDRKAICLEHRMRPTVGIHQ